METQLKESAMKQEERLTRIHERFDEVSKDIQTRLPGWATLLIALLGSLSAGLAVAAFK